MVSKEEVQRNLILAAFPDETVGSGPTRNGEQPAAYLAPAPGDYEYEYLYQEGYIVVREDLLGAVTELLGATAAPIAVTDGVRLLPLPRGLTTEEALQRVTGVHGPGGFAPDYLLALSGWCNPTEPRPVNVRAIRAGRQRRDVGGGVHVVILDNGIDFDAVATHPLLDGVAGDRDEGVTTDDQGVVWLREYGVGHGTFLAGVVRSLAPGARVTVVRAFPRAGTVFETDLVRTMDTMLYTLHPDVICLPAGTRVADGTGLLAFRTFLDNRLSLHRGIVVITAAGNDNSSKPFWPAAGAGVVAVGSLTVDGEERAWFTNFGGWVDVYAPGENLINAFPSGRYEYREPPNEDTVVEFYGMAEWSGTSLSAAMVAGMTAARMWSTGQNGRDAVADLITEAQAAALPGIGARLVP